MSENELRCSKRKHAVVENEVIEVHCRHHSYRGKDDQRVLVYHRWRVVDGKVEKLTDRKEVLLSKDP